jgi:hypothetical protein
MSTQSGMKIGQLIKKTKSRNTNTWVCMCTFTVYHLYYVTNCNICELVGFMIFMAVSTKSSIFWDIMSHSSPKIHTYFWETCYLPLHGWINEEKKAWSKYQLLSASCWFLVGLFFKPNDGRDLFLQNAGLFSMDCMALDLRRQTSSSQNFFQFTENLLKGILK